jgi:hypothetical protein
VTRLSALQGDFLGALHGRAAANWASAAGPFLAPDEGDVERRWAIYETGYRARLAEALENDYPALRRILGERAFRSLSARYVERCPPRSHDIGRAGDRLASFLDHDPLAAELPFLPDLARYEWALAEAFVARDGEPLAWSELAALGPAAVADTTFGLMPGTRLVRSRWPLEALWACQELADEEVSIDLGRASPPQLVYRDGLDVRRVLVGETEARLVEAAASGLSLAERAAGTGGAADELVAGFRRLVEMGVIEKPGSPRPAAAAKQGEDEP